MTTLYGISNCDTVKKARQWLEQHCVDFHFHDIIGHPLSEQQLYDWVHELGWLALVNKRSKTWRQLNLTTRENMNDQLAVVTLCKHPTLMKRPVLDTGNELTIGFSVQSYQNLFKHHTI